MPRSEFLTCPRVLCCILPPYAYAQTISALRTEGNNLSKTSRREDATSGGFLPNRHHGVPDAITLIAMPAPLSMSCKSAQWLPCTAISCTTSAISIANQFLCQTKLRPPMHNPETAISAKLAYIARCTTQAQRCGYAGLWFWVMQLVA